MSLPLNIEIYNELECYFNKGATFITLPSVSGEIGILPKHIKFFSVLTKGTVSIDSEESGAKKNYIFNISGGFVEVDDNRVKLFAEDVEDAKSGEG